MPRQSPYRIVLSATEKRTLTARAAKYTRPYFEVRRAKMILLDGRGPNEAIVMRAQFRPAGSGPLWRKRFFEDRFAGLDGYARGGPELFPGDQRSSSP